MNGGRVLQWKTFTSIQNIDSVNSVICWSTFHYSAGGNFHFYLMRIDLGNDVRLGDRWVKVCSSMRCDQTQSDLKSSNCGAAPANARRDWGLGRLPRRRHHQLWRLAPLAVFPPTTCCWRFTKAILHVGQHHASSSSFRLPFGSISRGNVVPPSGHNRVDSCISRTGL